MFKWLADLLPSRSVFQVYAPKGWTSHRIRPLAPADYNACEAIFLANEGSVSSSQHFEHFAAWLRNTTETILVGDSAAGVVSFGGVGMHRKSHAVQLTYGMVHPDHQRHRFGSALLLARICALPNNPASLLLSAVVPETAAAFHRRFGFTRTAQVASEDGKTLHICQALLNSAGRLAAQQALDAAAITLEIPIRVEPTLRAPRSLRD